MDPRGEVFFSAIHRTRTVLLITAASGHPGSGRDVHECTRLLPVESVPGAADPVSGFARMARLAEPGIDKKPRLRPSRNSSSACRGGRSASGRRLPEVVSEMMLNELAFGCQFRVLWHIDRFVIETEQYLPVCSSNQS